MKPKSETMKATVQFEAYVTDGYDIDKSVMKILVQGKNWSGWTIFVNQNWSGRTDFATQLSGLDARNLL